MDEYNNYKETLYSDPYSYPHVSTRHLTNSGNNGYSSGYSESFTNILNLNRYSSRRYSQRKRQKREDSSKRKIREYIESFTVHGLTRIFIGSKFESFIWTFLLSCGIALCSYVISGLVSKYLKYEVDSVMRYVATPKNTFPSIRICEEGLTNIAFFAFCGLQSAIPGQRNCSDEIVYDHDRHIKSIEGKYWSNSLFNITYCSSWDGQNCISSNFFHSLNDQNDSCINFNPNGTFFDLYSHVNINFEFQMPHFIKRDPVIVLIPTDPRVYETDLTRVVRIMPEKFYNIILEKTYIKRLPTPYPSNCSEEKNHDIFPGKYARRQCMESHTLKHLYMKCGAVFDYARKYMSKEFLDKYKSETEDPEVLRKCIMKQSMQKQEDIGDCKFPCDELDISMLTNVYDIPRKTNDGRFRYTLDIGYRVVDTFKLLEENPRYTWDKMLSDIGGFLGLVIGASIMSFFEIIACLIIKFISMIHNLNQKQKRVLSRRESKKSLLMRQNKLYETKTTEYYM